MLAHTHTQTAAQPPPGARRGHAARRDDEPDVVRRAQGGDDEAFAVLHDRYRRHIFNYLYRCSGDARVAEDLTQDVFLKAWLRLPETAPGLLWGAWLYTIATNCFRDRYRHERLLTWQDWDAYAGTFHPAQVAPDRPEREVLDAETRREVREVLDALAATPDDYRYLHTEGRGRAYRAVLERYYLDGLSLKEVAAATGLTYAGMRSLVHRARDAFREAWEARHGHQGQQGHPGHPGHPGRAVEGAPA